MPLIPTPSVLTLLLYVLLNQTDYPIILIKAYLIQNFKLLPWKTEELSVWGFILFPGLLFSFSFLVGGVVCAWVRRCVEVLLIHLVNLTASAAHKSLMEGKRFNGFAIITLTSNNGRRNTFFLTWSLSNLRYQSIVQHTEQLKKAWGKKTKAIEQISTVKITAIFVILQKHELRITTIDRRVSNPINSYNSYR